MTGFQSSISLENDFPGNIRNTPKTCSVKEVLGKYLTNFINLLKFLAILYPKKTYKGCHYHDISLQL